MSKKTVLIGPVRGYPKEIWDKYVRGLEQEGWSVYQPSKHTTQDGDPTGFRICTDNYNAIKESKHAHVVWDGKSQGTLFDLGMAFALYQLGLLNGVSIVDLPPFTEGKSFQNMVSEWSSR